MNTLAGAIALSMIYDVVGSLYSCQNKIKQENIAGFRTQFMPEEWVGTEKHKANFANINCMSSVIADKFTLFVVEFIS